MTQRERINALHNDIRKLIEIAKLPKKQAKREASKLWMETRWREVENDYELEHPDLLERDYYQHCCKTCKYRIQYFKKYESFAYCAAIENAESHCCLVMKWMQTRKKNYERIKV